MRCGCPICDAYMVQTDGDHPACVCPQCGHRCEACMGEGTLLSREAVHNLAGWPLEPGAKEECPDAPGESLGR